jgi:hypothetical protein
MAHFAEIDQNNNILQILVVNNEDIQNKNFPESEPIGISFLDNIFPNKRWVQTSYNGNFRMRYAFIGGVFYPDSTATPYGGFGNAKPYDNWIFNDTDCLWIPPVPYPEDGKNYVWNQEDNCWLLAQDQPSVPLTVIE